MRGGHITFQAQEQAYDKHLPDSDGEAIVDIVKDHEELYD